MKKKILIFLTSFLVLLGVLILFSVETSEEPLKHYDFPIQDPNVMKASVHEDHIGHEFCEQKENILKCETTPNTKCCPFTLD